MQFSDRMKNFPQYFLLIALALATAVVQHRAAAREEDESHESPAERAELRVQQRLDNNGQILPHALMDAKKHLDQRRGNGGAEDAGLWAWEWLGPGKDALAAGEGAEGRKAALPRRGRSAGK